MTFEEFLRSPKFLQALSECIWEQHQQLFAELEADRAAGKTITFSKDFLAKMDRLIHGDMGTNQPDQLSK